MKKQIYKFNIIAAAAASLLIAACGKEPLPEPDPVTVGEVELSSTQVVFPVDGGSKTVLVNANSEWHYDCDYTWISVEADVENNTLTFTAEKNTTGENRYGVVSVICGDENYTDTRDVKVMQTYKPEDLVKDGVTANCYVAALNSTYRFPAKVKGNGAGDGNSKYIANYGVEIKDAAYAELIWEATLDGDRTRSTYVIDGEPMLDGDNVYFSTGKTPGNAVIAVCNASGDVIWSWHIWVSGETVGEKTDANGLVWMDRNLGALSAVPSEVQNTRGLFYQWGRKDPFLPSVADYYDIPAILLDDYNNPDSYNAKVDKINELRPLANVANLQNGDGKRTRGIEKAQVLYYAPGNAQYAVEHPEKFISIHSVYPGGIKCDWYIMNFDNDIDDQYASNLWGNTGADVKYKSIFDPCPAGYVVPKANAYATLADDATYECLSVADAGEEADWVEDENGYGWYWKSCGNAYYPKSGALSLFGSVAYASEYVLYWTADPVSQDKDVWGRSNCLFTDSGRVFFGIAYSGSSYSDPSDFGARGFGANVRCVKE